MLSGCGCWGRGAGGAAAGGHRVRRRRADRPRPAIHPHPQLGRFTLRDEGKTIAIGKVLRVPKRGGAAQAE